MVRGLVLVLTLVLVPALVLVLVLVPALVLVLILAQFGSWSGPSPPQS